MEEIQREYARAATVAGDISYRLNAMEADLRAAHRNMKQLNIEAKGVENAKHNQSIDASTSEVPAASAEGSKTSDQA